MIEFGDVAEPGEVAPSVSAGVTAAPRDRFVDVDTDHLLAALAAPEVTIELFDDLVVPFGATGQLTIGEEGGATWSATTPDALATLSFADDGVRGTISVGGANYSIAPASGATHVIFEEGRALPDETEAIEPTPALDERHR